MTLNGVNLGYFTEFVKKIPEAYTSVLIVGLS